jgi:exonuclease VII large subunit
MPTLSLDAIQQRIAQRDAELQRLRRELEARQSRLQALTQRKQELQAKLQQIEAEMAAVAAGAKRPHALSRKPTPKKPALPSSGAGKPGKPSLPSLLVSVIRSAGRPLTAKHLVQEVKRRGFKSRSAHFTKMVKTRLWDLKKQGVVQRAPDQPGYVLAASSNGPVPKPGLAKSLVRKASARAPAKAGKGKTAAPPAAKHAAGAKAPQKPLRELLTQVLKKMGTPLTGSELAEEVLKAGYQTTSKRFADNVWNMLKHMDNVENVKGQGYRLKRGKS